MKKIFPPNTIKTFYRREKNFKEILSLLCFLLRLRKLKILLPVVTNVIFLYLTLNSNVRLQVEHLMSEVDLLVILLMLFI